MKLAFLRPIWDRVALIVRRGLQVVAALLTLVTLSDWVFYALNAAPFFDFGWGGLLVLALALILWNVEELARQITQHYIGPWQAEARQAQDQLTLLKIELRSANRTVDQLRATISRLEANERRRQANEALERLKPPSIHQSFEGEM